MKRLAPLAFVGMFVPFALSAAACAHDINLSNALELTDVSSGWYDDGIVGGMNHLVPSVAFKLHNKGGEPVADVQLTVSFWRTGDDGEWDSMQVRGIGSDALPAGQSTAPISVRLKIGYTLEQPRAELFTHKDFKDATAKIFALRGGKWYKLGEYPLERQILKHDDASPGH
jgi:hypothetical protein